MELRHSGAPMQSTVQVKFPASARKAKPQARKKSSSPTWCRPTLTTGPFSLSTAYCILHSTVPFCSKGSNPLANRPPHNPVQGHSQAHELARGKSCFWASGCSNQTHRFRKGQVHSSQISAQWCVIVSIQTPQSDIFGLFLFQRRIAAVSLWWIT